MVFIWGRSVGPVLRYKLIKVDIRGSLEGSLLEFNDFKLKIYQLNKIYRRNG